jgi:excisionase family DNA binding protein
MSPDELADFLGVPLATIYRWRSRGEGPSGFKVGRHVRYSPGDVRDWLDTRRDERTEVAL